MKILAIALASTLASVGLGQPAFAQQSGNQNEQDQMMGQMRYGPGMQDRFHGGPNRNDDTYGPGGNWRQNQNWRNAENEGWRRRGGGMQGHMGMMMGPHMPELAERGASFSFGNANARMSVHCPANESVETCVRAATQLLDKIGSLKSNTGTTSGANVERDMDDSSHSQLNRGGSASGSGSQHEQ
jgi:hypothetical protein